jgi:hypothetical protein
MKEIVLDSGALIALERGDRLLRGCVFLAEQNQVRLTTSAAVVAQVWRGGARQARLARLLGGDLVSELPLDGLASRRIGVLASATQASDVVDGHVALIALDRDAEVLTSDALDITGWGVHDQRIIRC